ncbi:MAG: hypothetical protein CL840_01755 [Crocinitomicaceae bacterium]|nr:hypothetical protein [Crocinitomicaceae bacterium]|tara:strand:- start:6838 stop:7233 length:396 start_codon:yes stop_codon:yes gene_type:complete
MKPKIKTYYFIQTGLITLLAFVVSESLRSLPYSNAWTELGKSGMALSFIGALEFGILNMIINSLNFVSLKNKKTFIAFELPSLIWLTIGIVHFVMIQKSGANSYLEFILIVLFFEAIMYNQVIKRLLTVAK